MKTKLLIFLTLCLFFGSCKERNLEDGSSGPQTAQTRALARARYQGLAAAQEGVLYVKFNRESAPGGKSILSGVTGLSRVDAAAQKIGVQSMKRVFRYSAKNEARHRRHGLDLWYEVSFDAQKSSLRAALDVYNSLEELAHVETSKEIRFADQNQKEIPMSEATQKLLTSSTGTRVAGMFFNDPLLPAQWHLDKACAFERVSDKASMNAFEAWRAISGAPDVIVSVVDGGALVTHPDLAANIYINMAEKNGKAGVDDDLNGYVDDLNGWNFVSDTSDIIATAHGTHVSGIVSGVNNNGIGISSIAGGTGNGDGARILNSAIYDNKNMCLGSPMAEAIVYGADNGAVISQHSWSYTNPDMEELVVKEAIDYFIAEAGNAEEFPNSPMRGGVVIVASGNNNSSSKYYPQAYEQCIAVTGVNEEGTRTEFANYGPWVDITAVSGYDWQIGDDVEIVEKYYILSTNHMKKQEYLYMAGTSQAAPMVSSLAALLVQANKGLTNTRLKELILSSVRSLEQQEPTFWKQMGSGIVDLAANLVASNPSTAPDPINDLVVLEDMKSGLFSLEWNVPVLKPLTRVQSYVVYYSDEKFGQLTALGVQKMELGSLFKWAPHGQHLSYPLSKELVLKSRWFAVNCTDNWGNVSSISNLARHIQLAEFEAVIISNIVKDRKVQVAIGPGSRGLTKIMTVFDKSGRSVHTGRIEAYVTHPVEEVTLPTLTAGMYRMQLNTSRGVILDQYFTVM